MAYMLTEAGVIQAEKIEEPRNLDSEVLAFMYSIGKSKPVEVEEVMDRTKMGTEKAIRVLTRLENTGFIEEVR